MKLSKYLLPVLKETPSEAEIISHTLMLRSGMISQSSSGIYSWLPIGLRVLKKIENIVREEQNNACLLYTSPSPRDATLSRMPSSA